MGDHVTISNAAAAGSLSEERCWSGGRGVIKNCTNRSRERQEVPQSTFEIDIAYQQSQIGGGDIHSWRLTLESRKRKIGIYRDFRSRVF